MAHFLILLMSLFSFAIPVKAESKVFRLTEDSLIARMKERNVKFKMSPLEEAAYREKLGHLRRSFIPKAEVFAGVENFKTGTSDIKTQPDYGIALEMNLYRGGKDVAEDSIAELELKKNHFQNHRREHDELFLARSTYFEYLYISELIQSVKNFSEINKKNKRSAEVRIRAGLATDSDRFEFDIFESELVIEMAELGVEQKFLLARLKRLLDIQTDETLVFEDRLTHTHNYQDDVEKVKKPADYLFKSKFYDSLISEQTARSNKQMLGLLGTPEVKLYGGFQQLNQREEDPTDARERQESFFGLRLTVPFDLSSSLARHSKSAELQGQALKMESKYDEQEITEHLDRELGLLRVLHENVHKMDENLVMAKKYYQLTQSEYARGVKNSPDVIGATEKWLAIEKRRWDSIRRHEVLRSDILSKVSHF